jgi:hypothetical protein
VLNGSEKELAGGDKKGGGKGLGGLLAYNARPVSNRKGRMYLCRAGVSPSADVEDANCGSHLDAVWIRRG